jgi:hypothetical protein
MKSGSKQMACGHAASAITVLPHNSQEGMPPAETFLLVAAAHLADVDDREVTIQNLDAQVTQWVLRQCGGSQLRAGMCSAAQSQNQTC